MALTAEITKIFKRIRVMVLTALIVADNDMLRVIDTN
jgi:hypothetical protein